MNVIPIPEEKSKGVIIGERERQKANAYSNGKRQKLMERAMALIYGPFKERFILKK
jgi:hypothetical protein